MPIPSFSSALKPRIHTSQSKDVTKLPGSSDDKKPNTAASSGIRASDLAQSSLPSSRGTLDEGKRRSFLPQRGDARALPRLKAHGDFRKEREADGASEKQADASEASSSTSSLSQADRKPALHRARPKSVYQISLTSSGQKGGGHGGAETQVESRDSASKNEPLESAGLRRSRSLRKPAATTTQQGQNAYAPVRSHTGSTGDSVNLHATSMPASRLERPKSLLVAPGHLKRSAQNVATDTGSRESKASVPRNRMTSMHTKSEATASTDPPHDQSARTASVHRADSLRDETKKHDVRPAFSTLQQHFTPRKAGKAATSTFLHPPVQDAIISGLSPELSALQLELLQLQVLHEASARVHQQWEYSAKRKLHQKFDKVTSMYQVMREHDRYVQEQRNLQSLREWGNGNPSASLQRQMQLLSGLLHELPALTEPGGRLTRLVDEFNIWLAHVQAISTARGSDGLGQYGRLDSAESLGDGWKAESAALARKLTGYLRDLGEMTQPTQGSSVASILASCKELLGLTLEGVHTMQTMAADVVAKEQQIVEVKLQAIGQGINALLEDYGSESMAWRT